MNIIATVDKKWGISKNGKIPWNIIEIEEFFNDITLKNHYAGKKIAIIMDSSTFIQFGDKYRYVDIVISSTLKDEDVLIYATLDDAIKYCLENQIECFIYGGVDIYMAALNTKYYAKKNYIKKIYITELDYDYECDVFFPETELQRALIHSNKSYYKDFKLTDTNNSKKINCCFCRHDFGLDESIVNKGESKYLDLLYNIITDGEFRSTRNANTWSLFGKSLKFDLNKFPLLTTKSISFKAIFEELLFFLKGDTNVNHLSDKGVNIWNANTNRSFLDANGLKNYQEGDMGEMYGFNFRHYGAEYKGMDEDYTGKGFDQIEYILKLLRNDPNSRRIIMTSFNPSTAHKGVLYPCHSIEFQFYVESDGKSGKKLSATVYNRSQDMFLGNPYNISSAALFVYLICEIVNNTSTQIYKLSPGKLTMFLGDVHLYENHLKQSVRQILREPFEFPELKFKRKVTELTDFKFEDLTLENYVRYPGIKADMVA